MSCLPIAVVPGLVPGLSGAHSYDAMLGGDLGVTVATLDTADLILEADDDVAPLESLVSALAATLDRMSLDEVVLVGDSVMATVALRFAATHPDRVGELVLLSPFGYVTPLTGARQQPGTLAQALRKLYSGSVGEANEAVRLLAGSKTVSEDLAPAYADLADGKVTKAATMLADWLDQDGFDIAGAEGSDRVREVKQQVTLVWGRDDLWSGLDSAFYLTRRLRNVRLRVYPGAGHLLPLEAAMPLRRHITSVLGLAGTHN